jgi:hypothetical protein
VMRERRRKHGGESGDAGTAGRLRDEWKKRKREPAVSCSGSTDRIERHAREGRPRVRCGWDGNSHDLGTGE